MKDNGITPDIIADCTELSLEEIAALQGNNKEIAGLSDSSRL